MEWIEINIPWGRSWSKDYKEERDSFQKRKLNQPGTLVKVRNPEGREVQYLIGDINELGGCCDDCRSVRSDDVITHYCVVWKETT